MHRAIADKLRAHPELMKIARDNIERWYEGSGASKPYLDEWRRVLAYPPEELFSLMCRDDEHMAALRQSSPFAGVLEPEERWAIYARFAPDVYRSE